MMKEYNPYLCGGTFFVLLLRSKRTGRSKKDLKIYGSDSYTQTTLMKALIRMFDPNYLSPTGSSLETNTSLYKKCAISSADCLPFNDNALITAFDKSIKTNYHHELLSIQKLVETFLTIDKEAKNIELVYGLLNLIKEDNSILPNDLFYALPNGEPITKSKLLVLHYINIHAFILGIWHFILVHHHDRNNKNGVTTIKSWHSRPSQKGDQHTFISKIGESYDHEIKISTTCEIADGATDVLRINGKATDISEPEVIEAEVIQPDIAASIPSQDIQNIFNISQSGNGINVGYAEKIEIRDGKVVTLK